MARGALDFVTTALPKVPICARKLGDRTSLTSISSAPLARHQRARHVRAAAPPECRGGRLSQGVLFSPLNLNYQSKKGQDGAGGRAFRDGGAPKRPHMRVLRQGSTDNTS